MTTLARMRIPTTFHAAATHTGHARRTPPQRQPRRHALEAEEATLARQHRQHPEPDPETDADPRPPPDQDAREHEHLGDEDQIHGERHASDRTTRLAGRRMASWPHA